MPSDVLSPVVIILASRHDLTCDYVVSSLRSVGVPYLRLNTEDLPLFELCLDPLSPSLRGSSPGLTFEIHTHRLASVYFRQPTFLREASQGGRAAAEQFRRAQWAAFMRSLMVFDDHCLWVNHPARTYRAEHKALQLQTAARVGFDVPRTTICNSSVGINLVIGAGDLLAVKGLDTVLVREADTETFGYTNLLRSEEINGHELRSAPLILQEAVQNKLDLRVTVVGSSAWCASVMLDGEPIVGDWRLAKTDARFAKFHLPAAIVERCISLVQGIGLQFGAVDLALSDGKYYFLEVNPTGEWAWLQAGLGFPISDAIARLLASGEGSGPTDDLH